MNIPRTPWIISSQYGMKFVLSQDNEIILGRETCAALPESVIRFIVESVNARSQEAATPTADLIDPDQSLLFDGRA